MKSDKSQTCTAHGVPALAGRMLLLECRSIHQEIEGKSASHRLKPGLHTLRPWLPYAVRRLWTPLLLALPLGFLASTPLRAADSGASVVVIYNSKMPESKE